MMNGNGHAVFTELQREQWRTRDRIRNANTKLCKNVVVGRYCRNINEQRCYNYILSQRPPRHRKNKDTGTTA